MTSELFVTAIKRAIAHDMETGELISTVEHLVRAGEMKLGLELYGIWIRHNPQDPLLYAICFNHGVALTDAQDLEGAKAAFNKAIEANPAFPPPYINLGSVHERLGQLDQAIAQWTKAAECLPAVTGEGISHKTTALKQIGRVLEGARIEANAEGVLRQSLDVNPSQRDVIQHWIALRQVQCKWPAVQPAGALSRKQLMRSISPLSLAVMADDPVFQLASAHNYNRNDVRPSFGAPALAERWPSPELPLARRLRIGFVSSDLRDHAVGFLTSEIFELHDRDLCEVFAYYCGIRASDATQERIKAGCDHWLDITGMGDEAVADKIASDSIDILVDLNGYTKDARLKVFALRPAPIIVNWLGFPGTMGSPYHNYIIADDFIVPAEAEVYYSEKVLRLPCYQPNNRSRIISPNTPTREEAGLPADAFVYCCFNGTQKITEPAFAAWMRVLAETPNSVLWLLTGTAETNERLCVLAEQHGVTRERIVYAGRKLNPDHLARYPLADLFLDTFPYGAHTTASDAMWMGVPVLTAPGQSFASRVCGSLATAAGIGELVCNGMEEYVARAIALGRDRELTQRFKDRLIANRETSVLFDTPGLVRNLERLYLEMWANYSIGCLPQPDLSNLEMLLEIGAELDHESLEVRAIADRRKSYREALAARHAFSEMRACWRVAGGDAAERADDVAFSPLRRLLQHWPLGQSAVSTNNGQNELERAAGAALVSGNLALSD